MHLQEGSGTMSRISATLLVGDASDAANHPWLRRCGVTHVLNCAAEVNVTAPPTIGNAVVVVSKCAIQGCTPDHSYYEWKMTMDVAIGFIQSALHASDEGVEQRRVVLVVCSTGNSRSALACAGYLLVAGVRATLWEAWEVVHAARPSVQLASSFSEFIGPFEREVTDYCLDESVASVLRAGSLVPTDSAAAAGRDLPAGDHVVMAGMVGAEPIMGQLLEPEAQGVGFVRSGVGGGAVLPAGSSCLAGIGGLKGKLALVAGALGEQGSQVCRYLADDGMHVALVDSCEQLSLDAAARALPTRSGGFVIDVTDAKAVAEGMRLISCAGLGKVAVLVNCGVMTTSAATVHGGGADPALAAAPSLGGTWEASRASVDGPASLTAAALPEMQSEGWGRVVHVVDSLDPAVQAGLAALTTTVGQAVAATDASITCNAVSCAVSCAAPAPAAVAHTVRFLVSPLSAGINGVVLPLSGTGSHR